MHLVIKSSLPQRAKMYYRNLTMAVPDTVLETNFTVAGISIVADGIRFYRS